MHRGLFIVCLRLETPVDALSKAVRMRRRLGNVCPREKTPVMRDTVPCTCIDDCLMYVQAKKRQFMHFLRPYACAEDWVMYVRARKLQLCAIQFRARA